MGKTELKIEIDADLLARARASGRDLSDLVEEALRSALPPIGLSEDASSGSLFGPRPLPDDEKARRWADENAEALRAQRERIDAVGVFGEDLRTW